MYFGLTYQASMFYLNLGNAIHNGEDNYAKTQILLKVKGFK